MGMARPNTVVRAFRFAWALPARIRDRVDVWLMQQQCELLPGAVLAPSARIYNGGSPSDIRIGCHSRVSGILETAGHGGSISIGEWSFVSEQTRIWSASSVRIGDRVLISHAVNIHDTNAHSTSAAHRARHFKDICDGGHPRVLTDVPTAPIRIEDDVWIGFGATILKGVVIGRGAIVGAGSVVTKDVPAFSIVVGNPARIVGASRA